MNIVQCPHCKVRYKESALTCPICHKTVDGSPERQATSKSPYARGNHWKRALLIIGFIVLFIPCILVLASDYIHSYTFTWSPVVVVIVIFTYGYFASLITLYKHKVLLCIALIITTLIFLFTLNTAMHTRWFTSIALPITTLWVSLSYIAFMWITRPSTHGFAIVGIVLLFIAIALFGTEFIINYGIQKKISVSWSIISAGSIVPIAVVMFYVQKYKNTIERWLHL